MKKTCKTGDTKSKDLKKSDERKYKKGKDSDSEGDNNSSDNENDDAVPEENGAKFDMKEYRKMLAEIFPSKYMENRISLLENEKKKKKPSQLSANSCASS